MKTIKVTIIGGGIAGLTAAYELLKKQSDKIHYDITLLEATERLGGRIQTLTDFSKGLYAELGAISIADNESYIHKLIKELNLPLIERGDRTKRRYFKNGLFTTESKLPKLFSYLFELLSSLNLTKEQDWTDPNHSSNTVLSQLDKVSLVDYMTSDIKNKKITWLTLEEVTPLIAQSLLGHFCDDISRLSVFEALRVLGQYETTKSVSSIDGGNEQIIFALEKHISKQCTIHVNTPVTLISKENEKTKITCKTLSDTKVFMTDMVIIATPISALNPSLEKSIQFAGFDVSKKLSAIQQIKNNTSVARVYFELENRFWLNDNPATGMVITDHKTLWIEDHTAKQDKEKAAILEGHFGGELGKNIIEDTFPEKKATEEIAKIYGEPFTKNLSVKTPFRFFWNEKPYLQGAYPSLKIGQRECLKVLQSPNENIFFCGEYTAINAPASINGAVQSAHRVIFEVVQYLQEHMVSSPKMELIS